MARMGASFLTQNAGKRSVTLNLKLPAGREAFRRLVASADALIEHFRPGGDAAPGLGLRGAEGDQA
jgi:formyl-CoA transferase